MPKSKKPALEKLLAFLARERALAHALAGSHPGPGSDQMQSKLVQDFAAAYDGQLQTAAELGLAKPCRAGGSQGEKLRRASADLATAKCPKMIVFPYGSPQPEWNNTVAAARSVGTIVLNVYNGPGLFPYGKGTYPTGAAHSAGIRVLAYLYTVDGQRPLADVERDVRIWKSWYPIDGFFVDNVVGSHAVRAYYQRLSAYIRAGASGRYVMFNESAADESFVGLADLTVVNESNPEEFVRSPSPVWIKHYPARRFGGIVYGVPSSALQGTLELARSRNLGGVYITDRPVSRPYHQLPSYFRRETEKLSKTCA